MSSIGVIWLVCDRKTTNFYKFYERFEEIGLLHVVCGLDVLLGIDADLTNNYYKSRIGLAIEKCNFYSKNLVGERGPACLILTQYLLVFLALF
ncbi:hypothetical protein [Flavobacterium piscis]|uniref:hypothetical protein n=1 Tax=Flavobacterium piscis TaxID=1114874 RepID=UPI000F50F945|nr:hypothetical protein [Flavobacterium piscis]